MASHSRPVATTYAIGVGASAGGLDALTRLVHTLPADLEAPILVVLHLAPSGRSLLPEILARSADRPVVTAEHGAPIAPGTIVVARRDFHLIVRAGCIELSSGPKENSSRPAVDPMFRSLAAEYGDHAIAVVLSGALSDGAAGAQAVAAAGGRVVIQDRADAIVPSMPDSALAAVGPAARVLPASEIGAALGAMVRRPPMRKDPPVSELRDRVA